MSLFQIPLEEIDITSIQALIGNSVIESRFLEYKSQLNLIKLDDKKEFLADISSFANASGGDIVFGIDSKKGTPIAIKAIIIDNLDETKLKIEQILRNNIEPKINFRIHTINFSQGYIIIIRVFKIFNGPAMINIDRTTRFFSRHSSGKYQLDYNEIKQSFLQNASYLQQFKLFLNTRIDHAFTGIEGNILQNPTLLFHLYPLGEYSFDFKLVNSNDIMHKLCPLYGNSFNDTYNIDGLKIVHKRMKGLSYLQIFSNGVIELLVDFYMRQETNSPNPIIYLHTTESALIKKFEDLIYVLEKANIQPPFLLSLSILNAQNSVVGDGLYHLDFRMNKHQNLLFTPIIVYSVNLPVSKALKPIFDQLWRAYGIRESNSYDLNENWT